ncbi:hypothetical protein A2781_03180 [Candidatus Gottesmanbacteria bacterium RIFCSPHIGHO2_01_FULL_42_27]|uniref:Prokaryotic glutathione synthetase ATP-binding domain-containing protein n=2 Tax=Candidatus Gottesmaniibacteriota TaxID=1752720 RepID=A0A1F6BGV7_9BACT|nr:MAG: hypothetical protein UV09_C0046G0002 [Candidatus Gottesmanbacteria bacterium GW2011_GWA2_42_18]OGG12387.1 MAG: hypothetical protein A2781_03180 [Candidatus Gottesmanbacteria bacterium RIFCSPHIGHO2_01_FULL_42_27]OGG20034.1 MAG: hypothetical protein A3E72_03905 [Candidatus Gottesmanbacteria bacterium RIFCSPHIGHO2_12_FULL_43_26]OGG33748.1 MAG: hypothetical protein A3G68_02730 [Candidatus Gottesmanbacteria bacterium RIFCSPLOWO2_12_FULL_42_10]OGG36161.1 MAG: hypothetical protein A2968_05610 
MNIAFVTYAKSPRFTPSDKLLVKPLESFGHKLFPAPWDNPEIDWQKFDVLILRSCWNYHLHIDGFLSWLKKIKKLGIRLWNPYQIVLWNIDKRYLFDLEKKGIGIIPTKLIKKNAVSTLKKYFSDFNCQELIVKPTIGASAYKINRFLVSEAEIRLKDFQQMLTQTDCLIQPLMKEIFEGEISMIFLGKKFSHAILKQPRQDEFRVQIELGGTEELTNLSPELIKQGQKIIDSIKGNLLYARVDGIIHDGKFMLMELELVEPHLFLDLYPPSALQFASKFENFSK